MSEEYVLKKEVNDGVLISLNNRSNEDGKRIFSAIQSLPTDMYSDADELRDWLNAIESDKKIVNPMSPREEVKEIYYSFPPHSHEWSIADRLIRAIAKEHPDVKDWLKVGEKDA